MNMWGLGVLISGSVPVLTAAVPEKPNIVLILTDDLGWTDLGCFNAQKFKTPHLDQMASDGMRFTNFHVPHPVSSPSRAGLLTGCYPTRIGLGGAAFWVNETRGIHPGETTLPQLLKQSGYHTAMFGKWHIGDAESFMPNAKGFDLFEGIPYSNSMWSLRDDGSKHRFEKLRWYTDTAVSDFIDSWDKMNGLTARITEKAVNFIETSKGEPFFLYVAHPMPHVPLGASSKFKEKSGNGLYSDVIAELDDSAGQILSALKRKGLDEKTLVVFTSDNGPWLNYGNHAGTCDSLREGKGTSFEGGLRVPCVMRFPGVIPPGKCCPELATTLEFLPTFAAMAGAPLPERTIDGVNMLPLMLGSELPVRDSLYCYYGDGCALQAVYDGRFKRVFKHPYQSYDAPEGQDGKAGAMKSAIAQQALYDLSADPGETRDVSAEYPEIAVKLDLFAEAARSDLGDSLTRRKGKGGRSCGKLQNIKRLNHNLKKS